MNNLVIINGGCWLVEINNEFGHFLSSEDIITIDIEFIEKSIERSHGARWLTLGGKEIVEESKSFISAEVSASICVICVPDLIDSISNFVLLSWCHAQEFSHESSALSS